MKTGSKATPIWSSALSLLFACAFAAPSLAQFVPSGKPGASQAPAAKDERVAAAVKFATAFQNGKLGDALRDHGDLITTFERIYGDEWVIVDREDRGELSDLFVRSMNIAFKLPPGEKNPPAPNPVDFVVERSIENGVIYRTDLMLLGRKTRVYLTIEKIVGAWRVTEVREGGEPALVEEFRRRWILMKRHVTPIDFMRQIYAGMAGAETTQPSN